MKDTYYFSHDYNPTSDPKIQALIGEHGAVGYGLYWRIVEMLHEEETHKLPCKKYIYLALAKQMSTSVEQVEIIVKCCIELCELFVSDNELFWSERVLRNIEKRTEISNKRSEAGKKSAELRKISTSVEQVSTSVQQNPTKESKGKENKVNKNREKEIKDFKENLILYGFSENLVNEWIQIRKNKKLTFTETVIKKFTTEIEKVLQKYPTVTKDYILEKIIYKGWGGFDAQWIENERAKANQNNNNQNTGHKNEGSNMKYALEWLNNGY